MLGRLKNRLRRHVNFTREQIAYLKDPNLRELNALRTRERRVPGNVNFQETSLSFVDGPSVFYQIRELFDEGQYDVDLPPAPRIIDCGSNVGLSLRRFRQRHPHASIIGFEADPKIAKVCAHNLRAFGDDKTTLKHGAAWIKNGEVSFTTSDDDAGHIASNASSMSVPCFDLAEYFNEEVHLMKLDIEGGEFTLIRHLQIKGALKNLTNLVCEIHQRYSDEESVGEVVSALEKAGMQCAITSSRSTQFIGNAKNKSPFRSIDNKARIFMLYAWKA